MPTLFQFFMSHPIGSVNAAVTDLLKLRVSAWDRADLILWSVERPDSSPLKPGGPAHMSTNECIELLDSVNLVDAWMFVGLPPEADMTTRPLNVVCLVEASAFVVDVLDGHLMGVQTIHRDLAILLRDTVVVHRPSKSLKVDLLS